MRHVTYHVTGFSLASLVLSRQSKRRGLFAALFAALHQSRRLQALRVIRQHQHLIVRAEQRATCEPKSAIESVGHVGK
jgi:hypothetical protein